MYAPLILEPSTSDVRAARQAISSVDTLAQELEHLDDGDFVRLTDLEVPVSVARALTTIIRQVADGQAVAVHTLEAQEVSTTQAAQLLGISRPTLIDLLDRESVPYRMVGTHRRVSLSEVLALRVRLERNGAIANVPSREDRLRGLQEMAEYSDKMGLGY